MMNLIILDKYYQAVPPTTQVYLLFISVGAHSKKKILTIGSMSINSFKFLVNLKKKLIFMGANS